ncbi:thiamine pyrophosphate-binding protein [Candidatus Woesearchaeota archaeon]|nr:thiamine pyrophosphate-binding protein [Candidatus Woesearchaeota archaeon]
MKLSDYVVEFLVEQGIRHVFLVSGGAVAHLVDSAARNPRMTYVCPEHEQNAGSAADAYARITGKMGAVFTTSGPGATNLVTSVCNSYFDSIPVIFITGQVATFRIRPSERLRQKGFQETDVISIFKSITKYSIQLRKAEDIKFVLQEAVHAATSGRMGPVLVDIPDDLQRVEIDPEKLRDFKPLAAQAGAVNPANDLSAVKDVFAAIRSAKRPVLILGAGIRLSGTVPEALKFAEHFRIPFLLTWGAMDMVEHGYELNMGGVGVCGPRGGNFAAQTSDLVVALGTRLSQMITGGKQNLFAPYAKKIMVDVDAEELNKFSPSDVVLDVKISCGLRDFFAECERLYSGTGPAEKGRLKEWRQQINEWRMKYPICPGSNYGRKERVDAYVFIRELSKAAKEGDVIFTDAGGNLSQTMQAFEVKKGQRLISAWNHSPMGYALPAAIGAAFAIGQGSGKDILCIIGDGGIMMCLEELAVIAKHNLPIKIFVFNNHGHAIQKQTIDTWLNSHYVAVDESSGLAFADFDKIGPAFGLPAVAIRNHEELKAKLGKVLGAKGPVLCNVEIAVDQRIVPMLRFGAGIEDLDPKLPKEEVEAIMAVGRKR